MTRLNWLSQLVPCFRGLLQNPRPGNTVFVFIKASVHRWSQSVAGGERALDSHCPGSLSSCLDPAFSPGSFWLCPCWYTDKRAQYKHKDGMGKLPAKCDKGALNTARASEKQGGNYSVLRLRNCAGLFHWAPVLSGYKPLFAPAVKRLAWFSLSDNYYWHGTEFSNFLLTLLFSFGP